MSREMSKRFDNLLIIVLMALVYKTYGKGEPTKEDLRKLPLYKCMLDRPKDGDNNCIVTRLTYSGVKTNNELLAKPQNRKMTFEAYYNSDDNGCDLYGKIKFAYTAGKVEGFEIELGSTSFSRPKYYKVTLPKSYQQATGGRFSIGLTNFQIPTSLTYRITALPNSKAAGKKIWKSDISCVDPDDYKKMNCNASSYVKNIPICGFLTNKTGVDIVETTSPPISSSPTSVVKESGRSLLIVGVMIVFVLCICLIGAAVMRKKLNKKANKKRAVILASSGDNTSKFTDLANLIASQLKLSNQFEEVFFTGWLQVNNLGSNLEQLLDALHRSTVVILFASPFGKTSYENYLQQGQLATWKDEFILGAHSLFRPSNHTTIQSRIKSKKCTVYVVYQSNDKLNKSDFLHEDFERHAYRCYDLSIPQDNTALYKKLLLCRKVQPLADDQEPGEDEENATTKFI